jgi:DNA-binding Lrp family transcriptional regulator
MKNANDIQLQILGILTTGGSRTIIDLAKKLGIKPHVVRYQLDQLLERRRIERAVMLNQRALGHHVFNVLFDLPRVSTRRTLEFLEKRTEVSWLAQNMGLRKFEVTYFAKDMVEGAKLVHSMGETVGVHFRDPIFTVEVETRHWGLRFLAGREATKPVAHFVAAKESREPDAVDLKILHLLRHEGDASVPRIAKGAGISESTAKYRIERLRDWGAISEEMYFLRSDHDFVQAQLVLNLKSRSAEYEQAVIDVSSHNLYVEELITGFGSWDYKVVLRADTVTRLLEVEESILAALGKNVSRASMLVRNRVIAGREG